LCEGGSQSSMWWKTICKVREGVGNWFEKNIRRVVGGRPFSSMILG